MERSTEQTRAYYDSLASNGAYSTLAPQNRGGRKSRYVSAVFDAALLPLLERETEQIRLLDFGCGTGIFSVTARDFVQTVVGIDLSTELLRIARELATSKGVDVSFLQADGLGVPLPNNAVNRIVAREVFCTISDDLLPQTLRELYRVLEPGGKLYVLDQVSESDKWQINPIDPPVRKRRVADLLHFLSDAGFELSSSVAVRQPRFPWIYPIWFGLLPARLTPYLAKLELRWNRRFRPIRTSRWRDALFVLTKPMTS